jgi:replicative DNA helicase
MIDRPLPHSTEAEAAVLGAVLLEPTLITHEAFNRLDTDDFYGAAHNSDTDLKWRQLIR